MVKNAFLISEKFDPDQIISYVSDLMANSRIQACLCGWVEVLGDSYESLLFLVEKASSTMENIVKPGIQKSFTEINLNNIYHTAK